MANRERGEAGVAIAGKRLALSLNLGAMAEIEDAFDADSFEEVLTAIFGDGQRAKPISAKTMRVFLAALLRGNSVVDADALAGAASPEEFIAAANAVLLRSGLGRDGKADGGGEGARPLAEPSAGGSGGASGSATSGSRRKRSGP
jgi:hypothetical protein